MSLDVAIALCEADLDRYGPGTSAAPNEGTADWYRMYAAAFGLTLLRRCAQLGLDKDVTACARFINQAAVAVKSPLEGVL